MDNNLDEQILFMKALVDSKKQVTDEINQDDIELKKKLNKHYYDLDEIKTILKQVLVQNQNFSPDRMDSVHAQGVGII